ncbi:MAG: acyl carrier protein [Pseudomonadota bacterium]
MADKFDKAELLDVISGALLTATNKSALSEPLTPASGMRTPAEWDSLSFVHVFLAVHEAFGLEPEDDDAIQFTSVDGISEFLNAVL